MKRLTFFASFIMLCLFASGQTKQDVMVIEKKDGTSLRLNVDDIQRAVFETSFVNPAGTVATAVDLGLPSGVKWASWNLGATKPEEYGGYYGWGDVTGQKTSTDVDDYPNSNPPTEISGTQYDIAKSKWGSEWRLPTYDDIQELYENCQFYKSDNNIEIVGPNKNSIILPLAGSREETEIYDTVNYGYYWSGTRHKDDAKCAWLLNFDMVDNKYGLAGGSRHFGLSVRPVYGMPVKITMTTGSASSITATSAIVSGKVEGVSSAITVGVIYGRSSTLSETSGTKKSTTSSGTFSITLPNLNSETTYYYRVYAVIDDIYYFGEVKNFTTKEMTYAIGDYYPNSTSPEGVVFYTYSNGTHGKIFSIEHGRGTWYEATKWAESLGTGWYLPSKSELSTIASHYANYSYMFEGFYWSSTKQASGYYSNYYLVCIGDWIQYYNGQVIYNTETERNSCFAIKSF